MHSILKAVLLSCTFLFFLNCDTDDVPQESQVHLHEDTDKITFTDFLGKTKIKKFDLNIEPTRLQSDLQGRSSRDFEFTGFTVDTLTVKQLVKNGVTTFTLPVIPNPYPNNPNFYYNIVFYQVEADYQWSILEFEKTEDDVLVTELLNETTNNGLVNVSARIDVIWKMKILFHCTKTGECADGPCDSCELCISLGTVVSGVDEKEFLSITDTPGSLDSNSGDVTNGNTFSPAINSAINNFKNTLTPSQLIIYNANKIDFDTYLKNNSGTIVGGLGSNSCFIYPSVVQFVKELCDIANQLEFNDYLEQQEMVKVLIFTQQNNYFENPFDANFFQNVDSVSSANLIDPITALKVAKLFTAHYAIIKQENPTWSKTKVFAQAWLDTTQLILDFAGLVPVIGEVADLANGTIYLIQGSHTNAVLSYASAIPVLGWYTAGIKLAKRTITLTNGAKTTLKWLVNAQEIIKFGDRKQLRKILEMPVGDPRQAHHIIPWGKSDHSAIQKAASSDNAFHMNEALNGIPLNTAVHSGSHGHYDGLVQTYLDAIPANATPDFCYDKIMEIISKVKVAIQNNPGVPINQLNF